MWKTLGANNKIGRYTSILQIFDTLLYVSFLFMFSCATVQVYMLVFNYLLGLYPL